MTSYTTLNSPVGELLLVGEDTADGVALPSVSLPGQRNAPEPQPGWRRDPEAFGRVISQLEAYFAGELTSFHLHLAPRGTQFQQRVWQALQEIPLGHTASYAEIARRIGSPKAVRAVSGACAANNLAVAIPCHRVVRNDGALSGYTWGIERKRELLNREVAKSS